MVYYFPCMGHLTRRLQLIIARHEPVTTKPGDTKLATGAYTRLRRHNCHKTIANGTSGSYGRRCVRTEEEEPPRQPAPSSSASLAGSARAMCRRLWLGAT